MRKTEIIEKILAQMNRTHDGGEPSSDELEYNEIIVAELNKKLPDGDIRPCEGFPVPERDVL